MSCSSKRPKERGIALLVALFTLVLLSVVGLGLMYSTNMETFINANYRDKQLAMYAATSGLQEARDRLQPAAPSITLPSALPTLTNGQVIYIINPAPGETVAPWDAGNEYADTELCQEGILGLSGTPGVPCTSLPSGDDWYTVVDNSDSSQAPWNLSTPLDVKWTRITLKGNNMTPVAVNGSTGTATQACWDGAHQILRPAGYGTGCGPDGSLARVTVTSGGLGYTSAPTVTIGAPPAGGTQATGAAVIDELATGQLSSIAITDPGSGYSYAPSVSFIGGDGSGATATAVIAEPGSPVASLTLTSPGEQCYAVPPTVSFTGGGSGAAAAATLDSTMSCVASWTVTGSCSARKGETVTGVGLDGGGGSGFSGTISFSSGRGNVITTSIQNPGNGYTSNPTTITDLTGCGSLTLNAVAGYRLSSLTLNSGGSGYTSAPSVWVATGAGTGVAAPTATATLGPAAVGAGTLTAVNLNNPGSGYSSAPTVIIAGGGANGTYTTATATANVAVTFTVTDVTLTDPGSGYTVNPSVSFSGGGGSGAAATAATAKGWTYGQIFLVTSMAKTRSGARAMAQMEVASPVLGASFAGALTLDGPSPVLEDMPNSTNYQIVGTDANSCSETAEPDHPAIGGYDDPNASPPTNSVDTIVSALPRPDKYVGAGGTPSVQNVYGALGETMTTTTGLKALIDAIAAAPGAYVWGNDPPNITMGTAASPAINYVEGDLTLGGSTDGYGVLVVTGRLSMEGNFAWHGIVLVVGDGEMDFDGGGTGLITGTVLVAKIWDSYTTKNLLDGLGSPFMDWNGGGGNGIRYDHCWADNLISSIPFTPPPSTKPLKILTTRTVTY